MTNANTWPLSLYCQALDEAQCCWDDTHEGERRELEWSDGNLARMALLRDQAYDELVQQGGIPRCVVGSCDVGGMALLCDQAHNELVQQGGIPRCVVGSFDVGGTAM